MQYAKLGETGLEVSRLGFGCMRLPMESRGKVDREEALPMLRRAYELGVNYFDTAVMYCGGDSQRALGEAVEDFREDIVLSTKNHHYDKSDKDQWWRHLENSLERLRTDYIDIYNFHGLNWQKYERALAGDDGLYREALKAKEQGLIRHICHSFHGSAESLKKCIDTGRFESITCQYNLLDRHLEEAIAYAGKHDMGVVIMGPVGGGRLGYPSDKAAELVGEVESTPELAIRFVLSNPDVTVALSGMQNMQMLEENVETVEKAGELSKGDHQHIEAAIQERKELSGLYCTGCGYCMPCPEGVDIPANFEILNLERVFGLTDHAKSKYASLAGKAALCRLCGQCVEPCPQELDIPERLSEAVAVLDERSGQVAGWSEMQGAGRAEEGTVSLKLRYFVKNFTERSWDEVSVSIGSHGEEQVAPSRFELKNVKPYARRHKDVEVLMRPPLEGVSLDARVDFDGAHTLEHLHFAVAGAERAQDYRLGDTPDTSRLLHVPSPFHPVHSADEGAGGHSFDWTAAWDEDNLYVWADVDDDLLRPAEEGVGEPDGLRIFLDGRSIRYLGRPGREGLVHVTLYPPAQEGGKPRIETSNDAAGVRVETQRTATGYRLDCAVPWEAFSQADGTPAVVGFDLAQLSHDEEGEQNVRLSWTGREKQERNPGRLGRLVMID